MNELNRTLSVGSIIKKIVTINPALGVSEISQIIRQSIQPQEHVNSEFTSIEVVDEAKALKLALLTVDCRN